MCWMDIRRSDDALAGAIRSVREHEGSNGHSWGWAAAVDGEIVIEKGVGELPETGYVPAAEAALCHTRFATKGEITPGNAHPFAVEVEGETVAALAHNGTWYEAPDIRDWSDSRCMARILQMSLENGTHFPAAFRALGEMTGETIIALHRDGTCWVHSGRFPITREGDVVSSSGRAEDLATGVHTVEPRAGVPADD